MKTYRTNASDMYVKEAPEGKKIAYSQPSDEAFAEAVQYRLADYASTYALSPKTYGDIMTIVSLLQKGHCLYLSMNSKSLYDLFNQNGVMVVDFTNTTTNHAETIVGYITGEEYQRMLNEKI